MQFGATSAAPDARLNGYQTVGNDAALGPGGLESALNH